MYASAMVISFNEHNKFEDKGKYKSYHWRFCLQVITCIFTGWTDRFIVKTL